MRNHKGTEGSVNEIIHGAHYINLPILTCAKCGVQFKYRGIWDAEYVNTGGAICTECMQKMRGGPYDGKTNWEIK